MKHIGKRVLCLLCAAVMLLSLVAIPDWNAQATENDGLPAELQGVDAKHIKRYDASYFAADTFGTIVDDPESPMGKAYNASMPLGVWFEVYRYANGESILLSENHCDNVQLNAGYVFYKRTVEMPATMNEGGITYVRYNNEWVCQSAQIAKDLEAYAGKTIDFYFSAKVNGTVEDSEIFIDQMIVVEQCEGENCPVCGGSNEGGEQPPQDTLVGLPAELQGVDAKHIKRYDASYFAADTFGTIVDDPESPLGKAYNASMPLGVWFEVYRYADGENILLSENHCDNVQFNAGYVFYKRTVEMPATMKEGGMTYVRYNNEWVCQSAQIAKDLEAYAGKTIDFYFSAKVNGTVEDSEIFIDQMIVVDRCEGENCPVCGGSNEGGEQPPQDTLVGLPAELQGVDPRHIKQYDVSYFSDPEGTGSYAVDDESSPLGKAWYIEGLPMTAWLSLGYRALLGPGSAQNYWPIDIAGSEYPIDGQYHFYKSTWTVPEDLSTEENWFFVYHSGQWVCYNYQMAEDIEAYIGKTVDIYLSMKIDGTTESTKLYVDQMLLVERCEGENCPVCGGGSGSGEEEEPPLDPSAGLPEELKDVSPKHIRRFDASYFAEDNFGTIVDDAESPLGKAYNASMPLGVWFEVYRYADGESILLSENHCDNVQFNAGYVFYKRTVQMPETMKQGGITYVRYNNEWVCQSAQIAKELEAYAGMTIDFYFSAKVNGTVENCEIFIDQMIVVDQCKGENCPVCGENNVDIVYTADDFDLPKTGIGDCVMSDETSAYGKAAVYSYQTRLENGGNEDDLNSLLRVGDQTLTLYIYGGDPAESREIIVRSVDDLNANAARGEYVQYIARNVELIPTTNNYFLYLFDCRGLQIHMSAEDQKAIYDADLVDVTLSLKVTGDVTDPNNPPTYYIDKIAIKPAGAELHRHEFGEWTAEETTHSTTCITCGEVKSEFHEWDDGVVTKEPTGEEKGEKLYTCTVCGATRTEEIGTNLRYVFNADRFYLPRGDSLVTDPTSSVGVAAALSYANRMASGQVDPANALIRDLGQTVAFYSYAKDTGDNYLIGELAYTNLQQNANGGRYVTYKFKGIKITPVAGSYMLYMFDDWGFQIPLNEEQINAMLGKRMDIFLSMKVTGAPNSTSNPPIYYIDRIIIQDTSSEGDQFIPYVPEEAPRGAITSLPAEYKADDFRLAVADRGSGDAVVSDPSSAYGKAAMFSYEKRKSDTDRGNAMIREPGQTLRMYTDSGTLIAEFTVEQLQENSAGGEYVVYEFKNINLTGARYMYMFDCWGFQIPMEYLTDALTGKQVDIKLSMKVTGDVTKRTGNTPAYYFDYLSITEAEPIPEHEHEYGEWTTDVLNHSRTCTICSLKQEGMHTWDEGVVTKEATETENGETVYTCKVCGMKETKRIKKLGTGTEEPTPINLGWILGGTAAGLFAIAAAVVVIVLIVKKSGKKS